MAVRLALSTFTGYSWSCSTQVPTATVFWAASLTCWSSASSLHATLMCSIFLVSLITMAQHQFACPSTVQISSSIAFLTASGCALHLFSSTILDVSIVQYSISVIVDGVVFIEVRVRTLL